MSRIGFSADEIKKLLVGRPAALIDRILEEGIQFWDWVEDEVAISRALDEDVTVIARLTWYERQTALERLAHASYEADADQIRWLAQLWDINSESLRHRFYDYRVRAATRAQDG